MHCVCRKLADTLKKKTKRKKKSCRTSLSGDSTPQGPPALSALDDTESEQPITPKSTLDSDSTEGNDPAMDHSSHPASEPLTGQPLTQSRPASVGGDSSEVSTVPGTSREVATAHHSRASSATADLDSQSSDGEAGLDPARHEDARADLEAAVTQANSAIEVGIAAGDDVLQMVVDELDAAIKQAIKAAISAKYSKKVRKRLHLLLQEAVTAAAASDEDAPTRGYALAGYEPAGPPAQEWQTAGGRAHRLPSSRAESSAVVSASSVGSQSPRQQQRQRHRHGQAQQGHSLHALLPPEAQFVGAAGPPPPPPPPRQPSPHLHKGETMPSRRSRTASGNAWGVPIKQGSSSQVACMPSPYCVASYLCCLIPVLHHTCVPSHNATSYLCYFMVVLHHACVTSNMLHHTCVTSYTPRHTCVASYLCYIIPVLHHTCYIILVLRHTCVTSYLCYIKHVASNMLYHTYVTVYMPCHACVTSDLCCIIPLLHHTCCIIAALHHTWIASYLCFVIVPILPIV